MKIPLIIAYILNLFDYLFTIYWVIEFGIDIELNPIGRWMLENHVAWVFKVFVIGGLFVLLHRYIRQHQKIAYLAYVPLVAYALVVVYHVAILIYI